MDPARIVIEIPRDLYDAIEARVAANASSIRDEIVAVLTGQAPAPTPPQPEQPTT